MRRHLALAASIAFSGLAVAAEEESRLPVGDLLTRTGPAPRGVLAVSSAPDRQDGARRRIAGEDGLMASASDDGAPPWFDSRTVCGAIDEMLGEGAQPTTFDDKTLSIGFAGADRDRVTRGLDDLRARVPQPITVKIELTRWTGREGVTGPERILAAEVHADPARTVVVADAIERNVLDDYDVEIAQASSIGDPVLSILRTGVSSALCVTPMPDGRSAVIECLTRVARDLVGDPIDLGHAGYGDADRCEVAVEELGSVFRAENGRATEVAWTGRNGTRLVLRVEPSWKAAPASGSPAVVVSPLFQSGFWGFRHVPSTRMPHDEEVEAWAKLDQRTASAEELVARAFPDAAYASRVRWNGSVLVLPADDAADAAVRLDAFSSAANAHLAAAHVTCVAVNVPAGAAVPAADPGGSSTIALPPDSFLVASFEGPAVLGLPLTSTGGTERRYVCDWDVEVAMSSRTPDPQFMPLSTGHFLTLTPRKDSADVDIELRRLDAMVRHTILLADGRRSMGVQGDKDNTATDPSHAEVHVAVEKPRVAGMHAVGTIPLGADGTGTMRQSAAALCGPGRELVVFVRVR